MFANALLNVDAIALTGGDIISTFINLINSYQPHQPLSTFINLITFITFINQPDCVRHYRR